tara:strand:- start:900 stop:1583 length:684 start_codon:yes stop_codon:yes gene_type:complete
MTPEEQKAYSPLYINEKYGGNPANIPGVTQLPNGLYSGQPGVTYDVNPNTGQRGTFRFLGTMGFVDESPQYEGTTRNRHGIYQGEPGVRYTFNPNTGEEGDWIYLGTMGFVNTKGDPQEPLPEGAPSFDNYYGGPTGEFDNVVTADNTPITTQESLGSVDQNLSSSGMMGGNNMGTNNFSPSTPMSLNYAAPQFSQIPQAPQIDYVKVLNNLLITDVIGGMMTGSKV